MDNFLKENDVYKLLLEQLADKSELIDVLLFLMTN